MTHSWGGSQEEKEQGAQDYPGYLFILVKRGKNLRSRRTKK